MPGASVGEHPCMGQDRGKLCSSERLRSTRHRTMSDEHSSPAVGSARSLRSFRPISWHRVLRPTRSAGATLDSGRLLVKTPPFRTQRFLGLQAKHSSVWCFEWRLGAMSSTSRIFASFASAWGYRSYLTDFLLPLKPVVVGHSIKFPPVHGEVVPERALYTLSADRTHLESH